MFKFHYHNGEKRKSGKTFSGLQNGAIRGLQIGPGFRDYNGTRGITNRENFKDFKSGQGLQIGAEQHRTVLKNLNILLQKGLRYFLLSLLEIPVVSVLSEKQVCVRVK